MLDFPDKGLNKATYDYASEFYWVSHTWSHMNMDWLIASQCNGRAKACHSTKEIYDAEFQYNQMLARGEGISSTEYIHLYIGRSSTPDGEFLDNRPHLRKNYSPFSLVTPEISGIWPANYNGNPPVGRKPYLKNEVFMKTLVANLMNHVVGDNSRPELRASNIYHAIITTNEQYGVSGVIIILRMSPNIAWNCPTLKCVEFFYEHGACDWILYGPLCPGR
eukprot:CFRG7443T1